MPETKFSQPPSTQQHFAEVPRAEIERSRFDRSHPWKGTVEKAGDLCPIFWDEVLPGDTFEMKSTVFLRLATPLKPFMDNLKADIHYFFVPNRLLWDNWQIFMGETRGANSPDPEDLTVPQDTINLTSASAYGSVGDYLGLPIGQNNASYAVNALPFRAYELIWYEWYRDQNIQMMDDYPDSSDTGIERTTMMPYKRNKRKDYFTSALPWPQKGDPVVIPLGQTAEIFTTANQFANARVGSTVATVGVYDLKRNTVTENVRYEIPANVNDKPNLFADLAGATATSINDLRTAFQIQRLLERDARGGTRYTELILSHFGVSSDDGRLQRPEFIGSGSTYINVNPIASTTYFESGIDFVPQGNLSGVGTGLLKGGFKHSFTEHGIVMGMLSIQADLTYQQGVERTWTRKTRYDYYWPALAHLGEQAVLNSELFIGANQVQNETVFGYQERYAEYRYRPGRISGIFRSNHPQSLDVWHLAQDFSDRPVLNEAFIQEDPPIDRVIAVPSEPHFLCDAWFDLKCERPMPVYSVPGMIDHF